jgi:hypothetical protein
MKIQTFKNKDIIVKDKNYSQEIIDLLNKNKINVDEFRNNTRDLILYETDNFSDPEINKAIFLIKNTSVFFILFYNNNTVLYSNVFKFDKLDFIIDKIKNDFNHFINSGSLSYFSPYNFKRQLSSLFIKLNSQNNDYYLLNGKDFYKLYSLFKINKKEESKLINYLENIIFKNFNKEFFKDCYSFYLHSSTTNKQDFYNFLITNPNIKDNVIAFKNKNSFLSMALIDLTKNQIKNIFAEKYSEDKALSNIKKILLKKYPNLSDKLFDSLIGKSYNHFFYFKTPKSYLKILSRINMLDRSDLTLKQINFLREVFKKNNTFFDEDQIKEIIDNELYIDEFLKILEIRKCYFLIQDNTNNKFDNIKKFIDKNIITYNESIKKLEPLLEKISYSGDKEVIFDDINNKKYKFKKVDYLKILSDLNIVFSKNKTFYNNSKYYLEFLRFLNNYNKQENKKIIYEVCSGRNKYFIALNSKFNKKLEIIYSENCTPTLKKALNKIVKTDDFINFYFETVLIA